MKQAAQWVILLILILPIQASAFGGVFIETDPQMPRPGEQVTVRAASIGVVPVGSVYIWTRDGEVIAESEDATSVVLDAPPRGGSHEIATTIIFNDSIVAQGAYKLTSGSVNIEWEGVGATVPLVSIRPLISVESIFTATAVVDLIRESGLRYEPRDIQYEWAINGVVQKNASGFGRTTFVTSAPFFGDAFEISVKARSRDGAARAANRAVIAVQKPRVAIYAHTPLGGTQLHTLAPRTITFEKDEISFIAYPLFVGLEAGKISWFIDDDPIELDVGDPRLVVFRRTGEGTGSFTARAEFENGNFLQKTASAILLQF